MLYSFLYLDLKQKEKHQNYKTEKKWEINKKKFLHERGVWKEKKIENKAVSYKINKYEDSMHRRYLLKLYKDAMNKEYLNMKTFKEKRKFLKFRLGSKSNETSSILIKYIILILRRFRNCFNF